LINAAYGGTVAANFSSLSKGQKKQMLTDATVALENRYPKPSIPASGLPSDAPSLIRLAYPHYWASLLSNYQDMTKVAQEQFLQQAVARLSPVQNQGSKTAA